jgi:hypothetical protein
VVVRPNQYEKGRAHIIVYNWHKAESADVDVSRVLQQGQPYVIVSAQNFYGDPVAKGNYQGGSVRLPMTPAITPKPVGMPDCVLPTTEPEFSVFVLLPQQST